MKRALATSWLVLCGLAAAFITIVWLTQPTGDSFWTLAKSLGTLFVLGSPAARYLWNNPRQRSEIEPPDENSLENFRNP